MKHPVLISIILSLGIFVCGCGKSNEVEVMRHDEPPQKAKDLSLEALSKIEAIQKSPYYQHTKELKQHVVGKVVTKTEAGTSGFVLYLDNGKWVLAHLSGNEFTWKIGDGSLAETDKKLMMSTMFGDASALIKDNVPYADQPCSFSAEVNNAVGKKITGLSYGDRCFNFCFPEGRELDVTLRQDAQNRLAYRVYWEQW